MPSVWRTYFRTQGQTPQFSPLAWWVQVINGTKLRILLDTMRLVEIRLPTSSGCSVVLKERVAISATVSQPILCFGRLLEQDRWQRAVPDSCRTTNIPLQLQNESMAVLGHIRVLQAPLHQDVPQMVRAVHAKVDQALVG